MTIETRETGENTGFERLTWSVAPHARGTRPAPGFPTADGSGGLRSFQLRFPVRGTYTYDYDEEESGTCRETFALTPGEPGHGVRAPGGLEGQVHVGAESTAARRLRRARVSTPDEQRAPLLRGQPAVHDGHPARRRPREDDVQRQRPREAQRGRDDADLAAHPQRQAPRAPLVDDPRALGRALRARGAAQDHLRRAELPRPRGRGRARGARRAAPLREAPDRADRARRGDRPPTRGRPRRLRGRARGRDRRRGSSDSPGGRARPRRRLHGRERRQRANAAAQRRAVAPGEELRHVLPRPPRRSSAPTSSATPPACGSRSG